MNTFGGLDDWGREKLCAELVTLGLELGVALESILQELRSEDSGIPLGGNNDYIHTPEEIASDEETTVKDEWTQLKKGETTSEASSASSSSNDDLGHKPLQSGEETRRDFHVRRPEPKSRNSKKKKQPLIIFLGQSPHYLFKVLRATLDLCFSGQKNHSASSTSLQESNGQELEDSSGLSTTAIQAIQEEEEEAGGRNVGDSLLQRVPIVAVPFSGKRPAADSFPSTDAQLKGFARMLRDCSSGCATNIGGGSATLGAMTQKMSKTRNNSDFCLLTALTQCPYSNNLIIVDYSSTGESLAAFLRAVAELQARPDPLSGPVRAQNEGASSSSSASSSCYEEEDGTDEYLGEEEKMQYEKTDRQERKKILEGTGRPQHDMNIEYVNINELRKSPAELHVIRRSVLAQFFREETPGEVRSHEAAAAAAQGEKKSSDFGASRGKSTRSERVAPEELSEDFFQKFSQASAARKSAFSRKELQKSSSHVNVPSGVRDSQDLRGFSTFVRSTTIYSRRGTLNNESGSSEEAARDSSSSSSSVSEECRESRPPLLKRKKRSSLIGKEKNCRAESLSLMRFSSLYINNANCEEPEGDEFLSQKFLHISQLNHSFFLLKDVARFVDGVFLPRSVPYFPQERWADYLYEPSSAFRRGGDVFPGEAAAEKSRSSSSLKDVDSSSSHDSFQYGLEEESGGGTKKVLDDGNNHCDDSGIDDDYRILVSVERGCQRFLKAVFHETFPLSRGVPNKKVFSDDYRERNGCGSKNCWKELHATALAKGQENS